MLNVALGSASLTRPKSCSPRLDEASQHFGHAIHLLLVHLDADCHICVEEAGETAASVGLAMRMIRVASQDDEKRHQLATQLLNSLLETCKRVCCRIEKFVQKETHILDIQSFG